MPVTFTEGVDCAAVKFVVRPHRSNASKIVRTMLFFLDLSVVIFDIGVLIPSLLLHPSTN